MYAPFNAVSLKFQRRFLVLRLSFSSSLVSFVSVFRDFVYEGPILLRRASIFALICRMRKGFGITSSMPESTA